MEVLSCSQKTTNHSQSRTIYATIIIMSLFTLLTEEAGTTDSLYRQLRNAVTEESADADLEEWLVLQRSAESQYCNQERVTFAEKSFSKKQTMLKFPSKTDSLDSFIHNDMVLRPGMTVELIDGSFVLITRLISKSSETAGNRVFLLGHMFLRNKRLRGQVPLDLNEICWIQHVEHDNPKDIFTQSLVKVSVKDVRRERFLIKTNRPFPELSHRMERARQPRHMVKNDGRLVCRRKNICYYHHRKARKKDMVSEEEYLELDQTECEDPESSASCYELRELWRGITELGGDCKEWRKGEREFLRQESICNEGNICLEPLESRSHAWPTGDAMDRGSVGALVTRSDVPEVVLSRESSLSRELPWPELDVMDDDTLPKSPLDTSGGSSLETPLVRRKRSIEEEQTSSDRKRSRHDTEVCSDSDWERIQTLPPVRVVIPQHNHTAWDNAYYETETLLSQKLDDTLTLSQEKEEKGYRLAQHLPWLSGLGKDSRYTFGDSFCCAGGMSRAAVMSGMRVPWGFDADLNTCESYLLNNFETCVYNLWADEFLRLPAKYDLRVDVLHISPPCQFFSPAHTREGKLDEQNTASQTAIQELIERCKPRVVVVEQTAGLFQAEKHRPWFNALINIFTSKGFSIRWKVLHCADYGVPQSRRRLFIIASCPGEPLPPFPSPTHSKTEADGLKPWVTINSAINNIPAEWPDHEIDACIPRREEARSGNELCRTICTGGDGIIHPSGRRDFTDRELANLQTFPLCHKFGWKEVRKQIGNAVPPLMGKAILDCVIKSMRDFDEGLR